MCSTSDSSLRPGPPTQRCALALASSSSGVTATTTDQLTEFRAALPIGEVELDVPTLLGSDPDAEVVRVVKAARSKLTESTVVLSTLRNVVTANSPAESLRIAATVAAALTEATRQIVQARPSVVIAKGGITSSSRALAWGAATIVGPLVDATLPVWQGLA